MRIIRPDEFRLVPWRNGRGQTTEMLVEPGPEGEPFLWRLSRATISEDGPFSDFSGYDRHLLLLSGQGVELSYDNGQKTLLQHRLDMAIFSGDWQTSARLLCGPVQDFNIMTRRDVCSAQVTTFREAGDHGLLFDGDILLIYSLDRPCVIAAPQRPVITLPSGHLLECREATHGVWRLSAHAAVAVNLRLVS